MFAKLRRSSAAGLLRLYGFAGAVVLFAGFVLYANWILGRLEDRSRAFVEPLARLYSYLPVIDDKETSDRVAQAIRGVSSGSGLRFIIVDSQGEAALARGIDEELQRQLDAGKPLNDRQQERLENAMEQMRRRSKNRVSIEYPPDYQQRRIIGRLYYGDVDVDLLSDIPLAVADVDGNPVGWRIYGEWETPATNPEGLPKARAFMRGAKRFNRVDDLQINPRLEQGVFYYELPPLRALEWMPYIQTFLALLFALGAVPLYRRVRLQEQAAVWAGLAKEGAHQLGSPISSLMGWIDLADEGGAEDSNLDIHAEMRRDVERLRQVAARFSEIGNEPRLRPVDAIEAARSSASYFRERLPQLGGEIDILERYESVPQVRANETLLRWVIDNLVRNAADAVVNRPDQTQKGEIEVSAAYEFRSKCVIIMVTDNGDGVARSDRRRIFEPGFTTKAGGWGIGLALARRIVEGPFEGSIALVKTGSSGSTFRVELPAVENAGGDSTSTTP